MAHLSLLFQLEGRLIGPALLVVGIAAFALGVHQVEVEVLHAAGIQLALQQGPDVRLGFEKAAGELVGQDVLVPGIAAGEALFQRRLAFALDIAVGGVKIVKARLQKGIHHFLGLLDIHLFALHRQPHAAKAKVLFNCIHGNAPS